MNPKTPATVACKEQQDLIFTQQQYQILLATLYFGSLQFVSLAGIALYYYYIYFHTDVTDHICC